MMHPVVCSNGEMVMLPVARCKVGRVMLPVACINGGRVMLPVDCSKERLESVGRYAGSSHSSL